jgi:hypothetical protein
VGSIPTGLLIARSCLKQCKGGDLKSFSGNKAGKSLHDINCVGAKSPQQNNYKIMKAKQNKK